MLMTGLKNWLRLAAYAAAAVSLSFSVQAKEGDIWQVSVAVGNAREQPATNADLVAQLTRGTRVTEIKRLGAWLQVATPTGETAWMHQVTLNPAATLVNEPVNTLPANPVVSHQPAIHQAAAETSKSRVQLFGKELTQVNRQQMRSVLAKSQVVILRELDIYPYDLYDPSAWWSGATEMVIGYTLETQKFAVAEITFRSQQDTEQVRQVAEEIAKELGPWNRVLGRRASGPVEFEWRKEGIRVLVHRGWPDTTTYLVYEVPANLHLMQEEIKQE